MRFVLGFASGWRAWTSAIVVATVAAWLAPMAKADSPVPGLPTDIAKRGTIIIGVKCDYPPFGSVDAAGKNVGFEIDIARRLGQDAFGSPDKADLVCVTGPNRIPFITSGRVDLVLSVLSYTPDRAKIIGFSDPYFESSVKMLVPKDSAIKDWSDLNGKSATTTSGSTSSIWMKTCMPKIDQVLFDNTASSISALKQGRAVAFPQDITLLVGLAATDPSLTIRGRGVARGPYGIGLKLDDAALAKWVNEALSRMRKEDFFWTQLTKSVPADNLDVFKDAVPRPDRPAMNYDHADDIYKCD